MAPLKKSPARKSVRKTVRKRKPAPVSRWQEVLEDDRWGWYGATFGVILMTLGLAVDSFLHFQDSKVSLHDQFSFVNPWHSLMAAGVLLILVGVSLATVASGRKERSTLTTVLGIALLAFTFAIAANTILFNSKSSSGTPGHGHPAASPARSPGQQPRSSGLPNQPGQPNQPNQPGQPTQPGGAPGAPSTPRPSGNLPTPTPVR